MLKSILATAVLTLPILSFSTLARAQQGSPQPVKTTTQKCGAYTVQLRQNGFGDPQDTARLILNGVTLASVGDAGVNLEFCRDVTGDGVPEVMLAQYSGGAHCCFTHSVYSLINPPRRLLNVFSADTETLTPQQLDGAGPLELLGGDWRFSYSYGLPFADSPALPLVYSLLGGQYVDNSRAFPGVLRRGLPQPTPGMRPGQALYGYAALLLTGTAAQAQAYLGKLPPLYHDWLENYTPDIRQHLSDYGMGGWPTRAGADPSAARTGVGGSFSAPGRAEYLAVVAGQAQAALRLYRPEDGKIVAGGAVATLARPGKGLDNLNWWPAYTVRRATGQDDAVIYDARSGSVKYPVYRLNATTGAVLEDDALSAATTLLGNLESLSRLVASGYSGARRSPEQKAELARKIGAAVARVQPALALGNFTFDPLKLGNFTVSAITLPTDAADTAQVVAPVTFGVVDATQKDEYVTGERYTLSMTLVRGTAGWAVTAWNLTLRDARPYASGP